MNTSARTTRTNPFKVLALGALALLAALSAQAQSGTWTNPGNGSWPNTANWSGGVVATNTDSTADFSTLNLSADATVTLDGAMTVGNLVFGDTTPDFNWILNTGTGGPLTLAVTAGAPTITVNNQTATIGLVLAGTNGMTKAGAGTLSLSAVNTYTGGTTISAGTLTIAQGGSIASGSAISVGPSGTLTYANTPGSTAYTIGSAMSGSGILNFTPASGSYNSFSPTGAKSGFTGTVNYNAGAFSQLTSGANFFGSSATINIASGAQLYLDNTQTYTGNFYIAGFGITGASNPSGNGRGALSMYASTIAGKITLAADASLQAGNAGAASTISGTIDLAGRALTFTNGPAASGAITVTGAVTNNGTVTVAQGGSGAFTLTLSNTGNNYTGDTTVSTGTLTLGNSEVIPNGAGKGNVTVNGTLNVNGKTETVNGLNGAGAVNGGGALTIGDNNASGSFGGIMSGVGSLTKIGSGVETLTGVNTYSGTTAVSAGKLVVSAAQTTTNALTVSDNATLGVVALGANRLKPSTLTVGSGAGATLEFTLVSPTVAPLTPGSLAINGTPTVNIASCPATLTAYPLVSNYTANILPNLGTIPATAFGYLSTNANVLYFNLTNVVVDYWTAAVNGNWDTTTANWTNILSGNLFVNGALVQFDDTAAGASPLAVSVTSATVSPNAITVNNTTKNYVFGGNPIAGGGTLTKSGPGTLTLTNANTYSGGTTINGGTVSFGNNGLGTAGTVAINNSATLQWNGANTQDLSARLAISNGVTATLDTMTNNVTLASAFGGGGSGGVTKLGAGTLTFSAFDTYTGATTVSNGTLTVVNALGVSGNPNVYAGNITVASGAILNFTPSANLYQSLGGTLSGGGTINATPRAGGGHRFSGDGTAFTGALNVNVASGNFFVGATTFVNSPVTVTGSNGSFGFTALAGTTAQLGSLSGSGILGGDTGSITFQVGALNTDTTFSGLIKNNATTGGGTPGLTKVGTGSLTFTGNQTYTGPTTVSSGTLQVDGSLAAGSAVAVSGGTLLGAGTINGTVTVSGGTLRGTLTVAGATTVNSGGTLAVATATNLGTLTVNSTLTLNGGGTNVMRITKNNGFPECDIVAGAAPMVLGGTLVLQNVTTNGNPLAAGDIFFLFSRGSFSGAFASIVKPSLPAGLSWDTSQLAPGGNGSVAIVNRTATPVFSPPPMDYVGGLTVTITSDAGSTIFYTTNGSAPSTASPHAASPVSLVIPANTANLLITAYATNSGAADSDVASATYSTMATAVWTAAAGINGGGSWATPGNWSNNVIANGTGILADFSRLTLPSGDAFVTLDGAWTIGGLVAGDVGGTYNYYIYNGGPVTLDAGAAMPVIAVSNLTTTLDAVLVGTHGLAKTGAGNLQLNGVNTYSGTTVVSNGTLTIAGSIASTNIINNAALAYTGSAIDINTTITGPGTLTADAGAGTIGLRGSIHVSALSATSSDTATANLYDSAYAAAINVFTDITTPGSQSYNGVVSIARGGPLSTTTLRTTNGGNITLTGGVVSGLANYQNANTLNLDTATGNGAVSLAGAGISTYAPANVNVSSGTNLITLTGGSYQYDYTVFNGNVLLAGDATFQNGTRWVRGVTFNGDLAGSFTLSASLGAGASLSSGVGADGLIFDTATSSTVSSTLAGTASLIKTGVGVTTLAAANTYSGATTVSNGTLRVNGSIGTNTVLVAAGGTLGGTGTIGGPATIAGTLSPGASIGTLTFNANLTLAGNVLIEVDKGQLQSNDVVNVAGTLAYGGTLTAINIGASPLAAGDSFHVFPAGGTGTLTLAGSPGPGLAWNFDVPSGVLSVVQSVSVTPPHLTNAISGGNLNLSWPADHLGWRLEAQINPRSTGLSNNWVTVAGSTNVTSVSIPVSPANPTVFYRLVYP
jgi:autotransporter-associated beta strand protein